jgi:hypothetical protein
MDGYMSLKCEKAQNGAMTQSLVMDRCLSTLWIDPKVVEKYNNSRNITKVLSLKQKSLLYSITKIPFISNHKRNQTNDAVDRDSSFRAGGYSNRSRKKYPVNGVFGVLCRHEIAHKMADITTAGET